MNMNIFGQLKFAEYEYEYIRYYENQPNVNMNIFSQLTMAKYKYEYIV